MTDFVILLENTTRNMEEVERNEDGATLENSSGETMVIDRCPLRHCQGKNDWRVTINAETYPETFEAVYSEHGYDNIDQAIDGGFGG